MECDLMRVDKVLIEEAIAQALDANPFSGVVLVEHAGESVFLRGYGLANRADAVLNSANTRFAQASGSKTLTAVAIGRLVDEGSFAFDTGMVDCLEAWPSGFDAAS